MGVEAEVKLKDMMTYNFVEIKFPGSTSHRGCMRIILYKKKCREMAYDWLDSRGGVPRSLPYEQVGINLSLNSIKLEYGYRYTLFGSGYISLDTGTPPGTLL